MKKEYSPPGVTVVALTASDWLLASPEIVIGGTGASEVVQW